MQEISRENKKSVLLNLFLFYILYFALILTEKQLLRKGLFGFRLSFELDIFKTIGGFVLGSIIVIGFSLLFKKRDWLLRLALFSVLILGSIFLNYTLFRFYYPPFTTTRSGDLQTLGEERWQHDYPFDLLTTAHEKYYLHSISINPEIENYDELSRIRYFGIYLTESNAVPAELSEEQYSLVTESLDGAFEEFSIGDINYRLYDSKPDKYLALTRFENTILFIPGDSINK